MLVLYSTILTFFACSLIFTDFLCILYTGTVISNFSTSELVLILDFVANVFISR